MQYISRNKMFWRSANCYKVSSAERLQQQQEGEATLVPTAFTVDYYAADAGNLQWMRVGQSVCQSFQALLIQSAIASNLPSSFRRQLITRTVQSTLVGREKICGRRAVAA